VTRVSLEIIGSFVGATLNESILNPLVENIEDTRVKAPDSFCNKIAIVCFMQLNILKFSTVK
jgi:hypothetical protein